MGSISPELCNLLMATRILFGDRSKTAPARIAAVMSSASLSTTPSIFNKKSFAMALADSSPHGFERHYSSLTSITLFMHK